MMYMLMREGKVLNERGFFTSFDAAADAAEEEAKDFAIDEFEAMRALVPASIGLDPVDPPVVWVVEISLPKEKTKPWKLTSVKLTPADEGIQAAEDDDKRRVFRRVFAQHPQIAFPQELLDLGFEDMSWKNDAGAQASVEKAGWTFTAWCFEEDPLDREKGASERFLLMLRRSNEDPSDEELTLYRGDSLKALIAAYKSVLEASYLTK